ncbi:hypothetical protein BC829DRAFT_446037 [Chytridium lagenaria]|nr:hypothetical protein BC829DRAFT_446037 [Chytridium lagenaria]
MASLSPQESPSPSPKAKIGILASSLSRSTTDPQQHPQQNYKSTPFRTAQRKQRSRNAELSPPNGVSDYMDANILSHEAIALEKAKGVNTSGWKKFLASLKSSAKTTTTATPTDSTSLHHTQEKDNAARKKAKRQSVPIKAGKEVLAVLEGAGGLDKVSENAPKRRGTLRKASLPDLGKTVPAPADFFSKANEYKDSLESLSSFDSTAYTSSTASVALNSSKPASTFTVDSVTPVLPPLRKSLSEPSITAALSPKTRPVVPPVRTASINPQGPPVATPSPVSMNPYNQYPPHRLPQQSVQHHGYQQPPSQPPQTHHSRVPRDGKTARPSPLRRHESMPQMNEHIAQSYAGGWQAYPQHQAGYWPNYYPAYPTPQPHEVPTQRRPSNPSPLSQDLGGDAGWMDRISPDPEIPKAEDVAKAWTQFYASASAAAVWGEQALEAYGMAVKMSEMALSGKAGKVDGEEAREEGKRRAMAVGCKIGVEVPARGAWSWFPTPSGWVPVPVLAYGPAASS